MKKEGLTQDRYISGKTIHDYLHSFAEEHNLVLSPRPETETSYSCR
jgi:dimethylaniline monooxygenase (N-oxide forming)